MFLIENKFFGNYKLLDVDKRSLVLFNKSSSHSFDLIVLERKFQKKPLISNL